LVVIRSMVVVVVVRYVVCGDCYSGMYCCWWWLPL